MLRAHGDYGALMSHSGPRPGCPGSRGRLSRFEAAENHDQTSQWLLETDERPGPRDTESKEEAVLVRASVSTYSFLQLVHPFSFSASAQCCYLFLLQLRCAALPSAFPHLFQPEAGSLLHACSLGRPTPAQRSVCFELYGAFKRI